MMLLNDASGAQAPFQIQYLQPLPLINPVDYPTGGSSQITVTAYWGSVVKPILISVAGVASFNASAAGTDLSAAYSVVRFTPPIAAIRTEGTISVTLQAATGVVGASLAIQIFNLQVFNSPVVQYLEPTQVINSFDLLIVHFVVILIGSLHLLPSVCNLILLNAGWLRWNCPRVQ